MEGEHNNLGGAKSVDLGISMAEGTYSSNVLGECQLLQVALVHLEGHRIVVQSAECCEEQRLCSMDLSFSLLLQIRILSF